SEEEKSALNLIPAYLYHGVDTEEAVLMRMNQVPRSIAKRLGAEVRRQVGHPRRLSVSEARQFVAALGSEDWHRLRPAHSTLTGSQYRDVWRQLSGEAAST